MCTGHPCWAAHVKLYHRSRQSRFPWHVLTRQPTAPAVAECPARASSTTRHLGVPQNRGKRRPHRPTREGTPAAVTPDSPKDHVHATTAGTPLMAKRSPHPPTTQAKWNHRGPPRMPPRRVRTNDRPRGDDAGRGTARPAFVAQPRGASAPEPPPETRLEQAVPQVSGRPDSHDTSCPDGHSPGALGNSRGAGMPHRPGDRWHS